MTGLPAALVVFGASGFVGRNLIDAFAGRLDMLVGVTGEARDVPGCTHVVRASELEDMSPLPADTVALHVAAFRYDAGRFELAQSDIIRHNAELASRIFDFCAQRKIREMRLASSVAVYPGHLDIMDDAVPVDLNAPPHQGEAFYAWSKRWQEILASLYAERFGLNTIVFRLSNPYGPCDSTNPGKAHVAPAFVMKALNSDPVFPIRGDTSVERDFTYVGDVVRAFEHSLSWRGRNDSFNVCTGQTTTLQRLAETVMHVAGVKKRIEAGAPGAFGPHRRIATSNKIKTAMGLEFTSLESGMKPTIEWYRHALEQ
jgi:nucleoside-diphosphate-sugar epimerase